MGTWGAGSLENDAAKDLQDEFAEEQDITILGNVLRKFIELPENERDVDLCQEAVAAMYLWVESDLDVDQEFVQNVLKSFEFIIDQSELRDIWTEEGEIGEWAKAMGELSGKMAEKLKG